MASLSPWTRKHQCFLMGEGQVSQGLLHSQKCGLKCRRRQLPIKSQRKLQLWLIARNQGFFFFAIFLDIFVIFSPQRNGMAWLKWMTQMTSIQQTKKTLPRTSDLNSNGMRKKIGCIGRHHRLCCEQVQYLHMLGTTDCMTTSGVFKDHPRNSGQKSYPQTVQEMPTWRQQSNIGKPVDTTISCMGSNPRSVTNSLCDLRQMA